jgi:hypothetical protein
MILYNFRKSRRSICISRWNGVIVFRDRVCDICDVGNDTGCISCGFGVDWIVSIRLGLFLILNINILNKLSNLFFYRDVQALFGSGLITDTYCFMNIWCASSLYKKIQYFILFIQIYRSSKSVDISCNRFNSW